jgi:hypothetical protein
VELRREFSLRSEEDRALALSDCSSLESIRLSASLEMIDRLALVGAGISSLPGND